MSAAAGAVELFDRRHRPRHRRREPASHLRSVLHDPRRRRRHRPRPQHLLRHRPRSRRPDHRREPRRCRAPRSRCCCRRARTARSVRTTKCWSRTAIRPSATTSPRRWPGGVTRGRRRRYGGEAARAAPRRRASTPRSSIAGIVAADLDGVARRARDRAAARVRRAAVESRTTTERSRRLEARRRARCCRRLSNCGRCGRRSAECRRSVYDGAAPLLVVVDDEQGILDVVGRFARRAGFDVRHLFGRPRGDRAAADAARRSRAWSTCGCRTSAASTCCGRFATSIRAARRC